jgi:hypothetical protein
MHNAHFLVSESSNVGAEHPQPVTMHGLRYLVHAAACESFHDSGEAVFSRVGLERILHPLGVLSAVSGLLVQGLHALPGARMTLVVVFPYSSVLEFHRSFQRGLARGVGGLAMFAVSALLKQPHQAQALGRPAPVTSAAIVVVHVPASVPVSVRSLFWDHKQKARRGLFLFGETVNASSESAPACGGA